MKKELKPDEFILISKHFVRADRKNFLSICSIGDTGSGKNRKWCLKEDSHLDLSLFPRPDDLNKTLTDWNSLQTNTKSDMNCVQPVPQLTNPPVTSHGVGTLENAEANLFALIDNYIKTNLPNHPEQMRCQVVFAAAQKYGKTYSCSLRQKISDILDEYHYSEEKIRDLIKEMSIIYLKNDTAIWEKSNVDTPMKEKERYNKISATRESLGRVQAQIKEYSQILELLFQAVVEPRY